MPVRVRPSASTAPLACDGRHATPRRSKTRFDSWRGHSARFPAGVADARRSSKPQVRVRFPGGGLGSGPVYRSSSGCDGRAHDFAKVEDQVRFLARTWPPGEWERIDVRGRRSLTAGRRSAKPQKRVRLPPAPLIACPVVPSRGSPALAEDEHVAVGVGHRELLAPVLPRHDRPDVGPCARTASRRPRTSATRM